MGRKGFLQGTAVAMCKYLYEMWQDSLAFIPPYKNQNTK